MAKRKTFGEMQFTFAVLHELMNHLRVRGWTAPFIPTQADENDCGYDARINNRYRTLFIQFKRSEYKQRKNAKNWRFYGKPFYQFNLMPITKSPQHNILVDMANKNPKFGVYYCAPGFTTNREFYINFNKNEIIKNSIFVEVGRLGKIMDNDNHAVTFLMNPLKQAEMHSEPKKIEGCDYKKFIDQIVEAQFYDGLEHCVRELSRDLDIEVEPDDTLEEQLADIQTQVLKKYKTYLFIY